MSTLTQLVVDIGRGLAPQGFRRLVLGNDQADPRLTRTIRERSRGDAGRPGPDAARSPWVLASADVPADS
jgi:hypothetical protein